MTRRLVLAAVLACAAVSAFAAGEMPAKLIDPYLRVQAALAGDKLDGVKDNASAIAKAAAEAGEPGRKLAEAAQKLERTADLKAARTAFADVSEALVAYGKSAGSTNPAGVVTVMCSMNNKPWLQKGDAIRNPYYGSEMLDCGEIKKP